jgi:hypothetical protein
MRHGTHRMERAIVAVTKPSQRKDMSKRFSILAAALVASGRSHLTVSLDHSASRLLELPPRQFDDLSIKERSRLVFADLDDGLLGGAGENSAPCEDSWPL